MPRTPDVTHDELVNLTFQLLAAKAGEMPTNKDVREALRPERTASNGPVAAAIQVVRDRWEELRRLAVEQAEGDKVVVPRSVEQGARGLLKLVAGEIAEVKKEGHENADERVEARKREAETVIAGLRQELEDARQRSEELQTKAAQHEADAEAASEELSAARSEVEELGAALEKARIEMAKAQEAWTAERRQLDEERREIEARVSRLVDAPDKIRASLEAKLEQRDQRIQEAEERSRQEREAEREQQARLHEMLDEQLHQAREHQAEAKELRAELEKLTKQLAERQAEAKELRAEMKALAKTSKSP